MEEHPALLRVLRNLAESVSQIDDAVGALAGLDFRPEESTQIEGILAG